jgi:hypothetical protein
MAPQAPQEAKSSTKEEGDEMRGKEVGGGTHCVCPRR